MQDKGIETFEKSLPDGKIKQVFFFDPDGKTKLQFSDITTKTCIVIIVCERVGYWPLKWSICR